MLKILIPIISLVLTNYYVTDQRKKAEEAINRQRLEAELVANKLIDKTQYSVIKVVFITTFCIALLFIFFKMLNHYFI